MEAEQVFTPFQIEVIEKIIEQSLENFNKNEVHQNNGWVGMKVFEEKSNRSRTTITKLLKQPINIKRFSVENGGWVYYPPDFGKWSFHYEEMMEFIEKEFYSKYNGGKIK
ncbi:DUF771 domain-containing protein [Lactococcus hircilactis]|uniref:DUF771 domain-containing protein n=1 Tax=Lactococcus hircilactis TaxID=1494462 RepID=A0A7X1Z987_9LACT|nr:DUF771 domain-containing protein [Lactococcus hircilactis]MQW39574.1 DUF771 domain-containing protein [Lactococcus hircilactis]